MTEIEQANRDHIEGQLRRALESIPNSIDFAKLAAGTEENPDQLRKSLDSLLRSMLGRFPNVRGTGKGKWNLHLLKRGPGTYAVEVYFAAATAGVLIFDSLEISAACEAGLIDELGNPVIPPPCCPTCLRPHGTLRAPIISKGEVFFTNHTPPQPKDKE